MPVLQGDSRRGGHHEGQGQRPAGGPGGKPRAGRPVRKGLLRRFRPLRRMQGVRQRMSLGSGRGEDEDGVSGGLQGAQGIHAERQAAWRGARSEPAAKRPAQGRQPGVRDVSLVRDTVACGNRAEKAPAPHGERDFQRVVRKKRRDRGGRGSGLLPRHLVRVFLPRDRRGRHENAREPGASGDPGEPEEMLRAADALARHGGEGQGKRGSQRGRSLGVRGKRRAGGFLRAELSFRVSRRIQRPASRRRSSRSRGLERPFRMRIRTRPDGGSAGKSHGHIGGEKTARSRALP